MTAGMQSLMSVSMKRLAISFLITIVSVSVLATGCAQTPPSAAPTAAPAAQAAPQAAAPVAQPTVAPAKKINYPEKGKTITLSVGWAAGSPNDVYARTLAPFLSQDLGTQIEIINKPGAAGQLSMTDLAHAKPDGYFLAVDSIQSTIVILLDPDRKAAFTRKDIQPISVGILEPFALVVKGDSPYKTTKDFVDAAKSNPEKVKMGDNGIASPSQMATLLLEKAAGVKFAQVHFNGSSESVTAMLGGHTDAGILLATGLMGQFQSGLLRPLGVFDTVESKGFPGAKPLVDQGYPNNVMYRSLGLDAPGGTPQDIVDVLDGAMKRVATNPDFLKKAVDTSLVIDYMDQKQYAAHWDQEEAKAKALLADIKISQ